MTTLDQQIELACQHLPEGWRIRIDIEKHSGCVIAVRPDESEVDMGDGESDISEQVASAVRLAHDEIVADKLFGAGAGGDAGQAGGDAHGKTSPSREVINSPLQSFAPNVPGQPRGK